MYGHQDLHWKDSRLYLGSCATGNSITPDTKYPSMWRVRYPDGSLSDIVNLTRARDGARCLALAVLNTRETRVAASPIAQNAQGGDQPRLRSGSLSPQSPTYPRYPAHAMLAPYDAVRTPTGVMNIMLPTARADSQRAAAADAVAQTLAA